MPIASRGVIETGATGGLGQTSVRVVAQVAFGLNAATTAVDKETTTEAGAGLKIPATLTTSYVAYIAPAGATGLILELPDENEAIVWVAAKEADVGWPLHPLACPYLPFDRASLHVANTIWLKASAEVGVELTWV